MKMTNRFLAIGLLVVAACVGAGEQLKVTATAWPPYVDDNLPDKGLAMKIVATGLANAGYPSVLSVGHLGRTIEGTKIRVYDVNAALWYSEERAANLAYSKPYLQNSIKFIKRKSSSISFTTLDDMAGVRIGVVGGYAYGPEFERARNLIKIPQNHVIQNLLRLTQGQIDVALGDELVLLHELNQYLRNSMNQLELLPKPLAVRGLHVAVSKEHPQHKEIIARFDQAIDAMRKDGSLARLVNQYTASLDLPVVDTILVTQ